jgi:hypothetical protein
VKLFSQKIALDAAVAETPELGVSPPMLSPEISEEPAPSTAARTLIACAFVRLRGEHLDALANIRVLVPWAAVERVLGVTLEFAVPAGLSCEVRFTEPQLVTCDHSAHPSNVAPNLDDVILPVAVHLAALRCDFDFRVRYDDASHRLGEATGRAGEALALSVSPRLIPVVDHI